MYQKMKYRLYHLIRDDDENDFASNVFDGIIISLIILNVILVIVDTFRMPAWYVSMSSVIETVSVVIFTAEYFARLWTADLKYPGMNRILARVKYFFSFLAIIDLLAIVPFYTPFLFSVDLRVLRALRLIRIFRLFKFSRYTSAFHSIGAVLKKKSHQLFSSIFVVFILMVIGSVLMYHVEHDVQPEKFSNALSGLWWAVATFTTVGYGDIYPVTMAGKVISAIIALLGIGLVAVPTGIISAGFMEGIENHQEKKEISVAEEESKHFCPYCGHKLDD